VTKIWPTIYERVISELKHWDSNNMDAMFAVWCSHTDHIVSGGVSVTSNQRCLECSCVPPVKVSIQYTNYTSHSEDVYIRYIPTTHKTCKLILLSNEQTISNRTFFTDIIKKFNGTNNKQRYKKKNIKTFKMHHCLHSITDVKEF
jgi:hypothetical protein